MQEQTTLAMLESTNIRVHTLGLQWQIQEFQKCQKLMVCGKVWIFISLHDQPTMIKHAGFMMQKLTLRTTDKYA